MSDKAKDKVTKAKKGAKDETTKSSKGKKGNTSNFGERPQYKYNVQTLAARRGIAEASVRVALRAAGVEKAEGNVYGWNTKAEEDEAFNACWPDGAKEAAPAKKAKKAA